MNTRIVWFLLWDSTCTSLPCDWFQFRKKIRGISWYFERSAGTHKPKKQIKQSRSVCDLFLIWMMTDTRPFPTSIPGSKTWGLPQHSWCSPARTIFFNRLRQPGGSPGTPFDTLAIPSLANGGDRPAQKRRKRGISHNIIIYIIYIIYIYIISYIYTIYIICHIFIYIYIYHIYIYHMSYIYRYIYIYHIYISYTYIYISYIYISYTYIYIIYIYHIHTYIHIYISYVIYIYIRATPGLCPGVAA